MESVKLFAHQEKILKDFPHKHLLCWATGTGKTIAAISLANKTDCYTLIICPKALKKQWEVQMKEYSRTDYEVMTKEEFKRQAQNIIMFNCVIVDESHYFFGMKSVMSRTLIRYLQRWKPEYLYLLTATPYRSTPWDVYRMLEILGRKIPWPSFYRKFFYEVQMGMRKVPMAKKTQEAKDSLILLLKQGGSVISMEECFDVPEQTFEAIYVETTKAQKKAIEKIDRIMPIERYMQEHQIVGGVTKGDEYVPSERFDANKVDVLMDLIKDNPRMIVVCKYRAELMMLEELIRAAFENKKIGMIHGDIKDRHEVIRDINKSDDYVLLVAAQCGEGYEVPECPLMIFYSHDWALTNFIQMKGRILRANKLKKNTYLSLVCKDTIDEAVYKTVVIDKADFHAQIYDKI